MVLAGLWEKAAMVGFFSTMVIIIRSVLAFIIDLNYTNPHLSPFDEFQRLKQHPVLKQYLAGGKRVSYGARALEKGWFVSFT